MQVQQYDSSKVEQPGMNKHLSIYNYPVNPEEYPDYFRRCVKAVTREDLKNKIQFSTLRVFTISKDNKLINFKEDLDLYTEELKLGNVIWPLYRTLFADNFSELVDEIERCGLYLFDFWGYVPGCSTDKSIWGEYVPEPDKVNYMKEHLGPRFLGFDNGEQDGRYIGVFAPFQCPSYKDRKRQYLNFQAHFNELGNAMQNHMTTLCSLNYCHYFAKEGNTIMLGAETAQALINTNLWYAYLRGAGKQYGLLWFGNASVFNRWGYKTYESVGKKGNWQSWGPDCGTSLNLLRRLLYTEYMYNCDMLGFEQSWVLGDNTEKRLEGMQVPLETDPSTRILTPVGEIQASALQFIEKHGRPGVLYTPVAILLDFFNGWVPPRHLYTKDIYKVWGNSPYTEGDYQLHSFFSLIYPGYEDSSFYHDESGFLTATPYGDIADVLFNDVSGEILKQYNTVFLLGEGKLDLETFDKLMDFAEHGGNLILTIDKVLTVYEELSKYRPDILRSFGIGSIKEKVLIEDGEKVIYDGRQWVEKELIIQAVEPSENAKCLAEIRDKGIPAIIQVSRGAGNITTVLIPYGLKNMSGSLGDARENNTNSITRTENNVDHPLEKIYDFPGFIHSFLDRELKRNIMVDIHNKALQYCVNIEDLKSITIYVSNPGKQYEAFTLDLQVGKLDNTEELDIPKLDNKTIGYYAKGEIVEELPETIEEIDGKYIIPPKEIRIFRLSLSNTRLSEKEKTVLPEARVNKTLAIRNQASTLEYILLNPTFSKHFAGCKIDAAYLQRKDIEEAEKEGAYFTRQNIEVIVDFSSILNLYPGLSLIRNIESKHNKSMEIIYSILDKAKLYGCKRVIFALHRNAETNSSIDESRQAFAKSLNEVSRFAAERDITVYLENSFPAGYGSLFDNMDEMLEFFSTNCVNLKFCLNLCHLLIENSGKIEYTTKFLYLISGLLISAPSMDCYGQYYDSHGVISEPAFSKKLKMLWDSMKLQKDMDFMCLDSNYSDWNEIYSDISIL